MSSEIINISQDQPINWPTTITMALFHVGAIAALFMFSWPVFFATVFLYWVTVGLGISMGYHRLHTHRSYKLPLWIERTFAVFGSMTLEGGPISWVATHRVHHQLSDKPGDPHSPRDGTWWAHAGWLLTGESKHKVVRCPALRDWRTAADAVGNLRAGGLRPACHLAGQLRDAPMGPTPFQHARRFPQQLVGSAHHFRRGLA